MQGFFAQFAAPARLFVTTKWHGGIQHVVTIHPHGSGPQFRCQTMHGSDIFRPDTGRQAVFAPVGDGGNFVKIIEGGSHHDRSENFLAHDRHFRVDMGEHSRLHVVTVRIQRPPACRGCGRLYHERNDPPKHPGTCDACGGQLYQRDDDRPEVVRTRLEKQKPPVELIDHYRAAGVLKEIHGERPLDDVTAALLEAIS